MRNGSLSLVHSVWCFAHRLNLVLKDVISSNPIDIVKAFCDWFTLKRRQVRYKTFVQSQFPSVQVRVIPQPSETRWIFYQDVVSAIISQTTVIESFLRREDDFKVFLKELKEKRRKNGFLRDFAFSFGNVLTVKMFEFAFFVLEKMGRLNKLFQGRYTEVSLMWDAVDSFKVHINRFIDQHRHEPTMGIPCLAGLGGDEIDLFFSTLDLMKRSMAMRFPCPSTGEVVNRRSLQAPSIVVHPHTPIHPVPSSKRSTSITCLIILSVTRQSHRLSRLF